MKTIEINLYKFEELSEEAQNAALSKNADILTNLNWWEDTYYDAKETSGLILLGFDIDRDNYCNGKFQFTAIEAAELIVKNHGETCESFKMAKQYVADYYTIQNRYAAGIDNEYDIDADSDGVEENFLNELLGYYLELLKKEFEYLTSDEAIKETLVSNEYDFTAEGEMYL